MNQRLVEQAHEFIKTKLDPLMREIQLEQMQDKEIERAFKEASRAENMVKFRDEIMSRPKTEWHKSYKEKKDLQKESKKDLKNVGEKFGDSLATSKASKLRDKKAQRKEEERLEKLNASTLFGTDKEARVANKAGNSENPKMRQNHDDD